MVPHSDCGRDHARIAIHCSTLQYTLQYSASVGGEITPGPPCTTVQRMGEWGHT